MLSGIRRLLRWVTTPPNVRWFWPRPSRSPAGAPAVVVASRLPNDSGEDIALTNTGAGEAFDIHVWSEHVPREQGQHRVRRVGQVPYLGARTTYVVHLAAGGAGIPATGPGYWVRIAWRNRDGSGGETCAHAPALGGRLVLRGIPCPNGKSA